MDQEKKNVESVLFQDDKPSHSFLNCMKTRRSIRHFSSEEVSFDFIKTAIQTAHTAPSGANTQPWFFAVISSDEIKRKIRMEAEKVEKKFYTDKATESWRKDIAHLGTNAKKEFLTTAPFLIIPFSLSTQRNEGQLQKSYYPLESTGLAVGLLLSSLHLSGLSTLTHTPVSMRFLNDLLSLGPNYRPFMMIAVGKPHRPLKLPIIDKKNLCEIYSHY